MKAILFPGQGSQFKGMGKKLFAKFPFETEKASQILGYDIVDLCLNDPDKLLGNTEYTQPAIYTVSALHYLEYLETNSAPDFLIGHSLGEYNALLASGAFDFQIGLKLVQKRGALMGAASGGGMAAVIGLTPDEVQRELNDANLATIDIANYNTPGQIVVAGQQEDIESAIKYFGEVKTRVVPLQVSAPFHSRYMKPAAVQFANFMEQFEFNELKIPVVANATASFYQKGDIKTLLSRQIDSSVQWIDSIRLLMGEEVTEYKEMGSRILMRMVDEIKDKCEPISESKEDQTENKSTSNGSTLFLGSRDFCRDYGIDLAYVAGAMYRGIASPEMVVKLGKSKMIGFLGTGGMSNVEVEKGIDHIQRELNNGEAFGMNLLHHFGEPEKEMKVVKLYLAKGIRFIEASAFMQITKAIAYYHIKGLSRNEKGDAICNHHIMAKISRPEVAEGFMQPVSERLIKQLLEENLITHEEAELTKQVPVSQNICVEADSGGHTDAGVAMVLLPVIQKMRTDAVSEFGYDKSIRVGLAGGIGTPESAACAFMMGADFVLTGSINQCTIEAGTSEIVKDLLQEMNVQDTDYAPAGDMFEIGAKVQVLKRGVLFSPRANKLYTLYNQYNSLDEIPDTVVKQLEKSYFKKSLNDIWEETKSYYNGQNKQNEIVKAESNGKIKMAMVFKWYFGFSSRSALNGEKSRKVDFQIHTGPALGAFNQWVKGTQLEQWRNRHVDEIGIKLMSDASQLFKTRITEISSN